MVCYATIGNSYGTVLDDDSPGELPPTCVLPRPLESLSQNACVLGFLLEHWEPLIPLSRFGLHLAFPGLMTKALLPSPWPSSFIFSFLCVHFCSGHVSSTKYGRQRTGPWDQFSFIGTNMGWMCWTMQYSERFWRILLFVTPQPSSTWLLDDFGFGDCWEI